MEAIKSELKNLIGGAEVEIQGNCKALVRNEGVQVKIEVNEVVRETLFPSVKMPLCPSLEKEFGVGMTVDCVAEPELYASKFCVALQRQHPRDIFDVWLFFDRGGEVKNIVKFLLVLDKDQDPSNGIYILESVRHVAEDWEVNFSASDFSNILSPVVGAAERIYGDRDPGTIWNFVGKSIKKRPFLTDTNYISVTGISLRIHIWTEYTRQRF